MPSTNSALTSGTPQARSRSFQLAHHLPVMCPYPHEEESEGDRDGNLVDREGVEDFAREHRSGDPAPLSQTSRARRQAPRYRLPITRLPVPLPGTAFHHHPLFHPFLTEPADHRRRWTLAHANHPQKERLYI